VARHGPWCWSRQCNRLNFPRRVERPTALSTRNGLKAPHATKGEGQSLRISLGLVEKAWRPLGCGRSRAFTWQAILKIQRVLVR